MHDPQALAALIAAARRLVVYLHDNPDPDAIAAGWLLQRLGRHLGVPGVIRFSGRLGRAENRALVKLLEIPVEHFDRAPTRPRQGDVYAVVDTQPRAGNNSFPRHFPASVVIDHHPPRPDLQASYIDVRPGEGACTTMVLAYCWELGMELDGDLATAAAYAILSETQDLDREATPADRAAYQRLVPQVKLTTLGRIRHPPRDREYYRTIARAMASVRVARNTCTCHVGAVPYPEVVAEVADFLVPMKHITRCLVTGLDGGTMVVSLRTTYPHTNAHEVMARLLDEHGEGGGHGTMAGGALECGGEDRYRELSEMLDERLLEELDPKARARYRSLYDRDEED